MQLTRYAVGFAILVVLGVGSVVPAQEAPPAAHVQHLDQRMRSVRWQARYQLLAELTRHDEECKRALEHLCLDDHEPVANQALVLYVTRFLRIDETRFRASTYTRGAYPTLALPSDAPDAALVGYCLGRESVPLTDAQQPSHVLAPILVLDPAHRENPRIHTTLTIIGILGEPTDAKALHPYLASPNDYVALGAAKAVLRLGDEAAGVAALRRLAGRPPAKHLHYVTEALRVLHEIDHPDTVDLTRAALRSVDGTDVNQPRWVGHFLLLAADVLGKGVWATQPSGARGGK